MKLWPVFFLLAFPLGSLASELELPFFLSQGGAGGASLQEDFSYLINPAVIGFQKKTKGAISYSFKQKKQTALVSFVDLKTNFPLAISYQRFWSKSFRQSEKDKMFLSSGFKVSPYLSLGLTVEKALNPSVWNGSLGSIIRLKNHLSMALFMSQILKTKKRNQRALSLAFYYNLRSFFSTQLDISRMAGQEWIFKAGVKSFFHNFMSVRLGGRWFYKTKKGWISGGLALDSPKLLLEYSLEAHQKSFQHALVLSLKI